jgi:hypothetical protein
MTAGSSFQDAFGGSTVNPSQPTYAAITMTANVALSWPIETSAAPPSVAAQMDITASTTGLSLAMPPGNTGSTGPACSITNVGSNTLTLTDQAGNAIGSIASTQTWLVVLTNNSTANGTWRALQLASTTSSATAASLAGYGLTVNGTKLQVNWPTQTLSTNTAITQAFLSNLIVWTGATGTLQLNAVASLGVGWVAAFTNQGTGPVTFTGTGGETINGVGSLVVQPGNSGFIDATTGGFNTIGALIGPLSIANGGTGASTAPQALTNFGGTAIGQAVFTSPNAASIIALLGLNNFTFSEVTIATTQTITSGSQNLAFVATAALNLNLPLTTSMTAAFVFVVYAQGGAVTLVPQVSDKVNNGTAGANFIVPEGGSAMLVTDANGNWWPLFENHFTFSEQTISTGATIGLANANTAYVCTAGLTLTLGVTSALESTFCFALAALGGPVVLAPNIADAINGGIAGASVTIPQNASALVITDAAGNWYTLFESRSAFTESSVSGAVAVSINSANTAYVATATADLTLPLTTTLTKQFLIAASAFGGAVTLTPQSGDAIQGQAAGATFVLSEGTSAMVSTDANGNWFLFFNTQVPFGGYIADTGAANAIVITLNPVPASLAALTGVPIYIKMGASSANTGATTLAPNGLTATPVIHADGSALVAGELFDNGIAEVMYDGANFELLSIGTAVASVYAPIQSVLSASGQTWQNVTGSRAIGTTYTNSNGRPIAVSAWATCTSAANLTGETPVGNTVAVGSVVVGASDTLGIFFIVPDGSTYTVHNIGGAVSLTGWQEL